MKRSIVRWPVALSILGLCAAAAGHGCTAEKGQLMLVFQTDMSLPKDIDAIRILATLEGAVVYNELFERLGTEDSIRLPATLGFLTPDDPSQPISIRVIAYRGDDVPLLRDVVTTIPEDRTATLQMPIQFLCNGSAEAERDETGALIKGPDGKPQVKSICPDGQTCVAGSCVAPAVDSGVLPDYEAGAVFGGGSGKGDGSCFDTARCFDGATPLSLERGPDGACRAVVSGEINVALLTQGGGICGATACYVALDADSDAGWKRDGEFIKLPGAVCDQALAGKLVGVIAAPAGEGTCRKKAEDLPTCGPWSSSGADQYQPPDGEQPVPIAVGQTHPTSLWVGDSGVYWTSGVTFNDDVSNADGTVKTVPLSGGEAFDPFNDQASPRDVVFVEDTGVVFWTTTGAGLSDGAILAAVPGVTDPITLISGRGQPEGLAVRGNTLYWTELFGDGVFKAGLTGTGPSIALSGSAETLSINASGLSSPYRIAAANDVVCWIYQGQLMTVPGAVACQRGTEPAAVLATDQATPRALALDIDADGNARAVYWANFEGGNLLRADLSGGSFGSPEEIQSGLSQPSGVAVDEAIVYWTNRGDGTVMKMRKAGGAPVQLAKGQVRPSDITVDATHVYWINEGSPDLEDGTPAKDGAILKLPK